jgi:ubiquinone/menaquinone biosynthesis C-methylase UbiE
MTLSRGWFFLPRFPEPEAMESGEEAEAYSSAAAQTHLDHLDNTFVDHVLSLGVRSGLALDVGTGPGQIPIKLALKLPQLEIVGIDLSEAMLAKARDGAAAAGLESQVRFETGDARRLPFPDHQFDLVMCNSLLHHASDPLATLNELARVTRPQGALLLRDLRRPSALVFPFHVAWYGRHYQGVMKRLFTDSVRAAYTRAELEDLLARSGIVGGRLFNRGQSHHGIERATLAPSEGAQSDT